MTKTLALPPRPFLSHRRHPGRDPGLTAVTLVLALAGSCGAQAPDGGAGPDATNPGGPTCPGTLAGRLSLTPISDTKGAGAVYAAAQGDGVLLGWAVADGVHLTRAGNDGRRGADLVIPGTAVFGVAARDGATAALVARGSDELHLVVLGPDGATLGAQRLLGAVDHKVVNNEWFGTGIRAGRLLWTGSAFAAYFTVQRLWPDNVAHYGDTLRLLSPDGKPQTTSWDWGCSHSMSVRLAQRSGALGSICASDCYPKKGVFFNRSAQIYGDAAANCAGSYTSQLGELLPQGDGFWAVFTATDGRGDRDLAIARIGADGKAAAPRWLTSGGGDDSFGHGALYGDELLVAYRGGDRGDRFQRLSVSGDPQGSAEVLTGTDLSTASDFVRLADGSVAFAQRGAAGLTVARLRACR